MSYLKAIIKLGIAVGCLSVLACSSSKNTAKPPQGNGNTVEVDQANVDLASYLRRIPGLQISGQGDNARVTIRGSVQSLSGPSEPLFVIDNVQIGDDFASVSRLVDVHDIDKVEVLKGVDASARYGVRGSNGVVIIRTKREGSRSAAVFPGDRRGKRAQPAFCRSGRLSSRKPKNTLKESDVPLRFLTVGGTVST